MNDSKQAPLDHDISQARGRGVAADDDGLFASAASDPVELRPTLVFELHYVGGAQPWQIAKGYEESPVAIDESPRSILFSPIDVSKFDSNDAAEVILLVVNDSDGPRTFLARGVPALGLGAQTTELRDVPESGVRYLRYVVKDDPDLGGEISVFLGSAPTISADPTFTIRFKAPVTP